MLALNVFICHVISLLVINMIGLIFIQCSVFAIFWIFANIIELSLVTLIVILFNVYSTGPNAVIFHSNVTYLDACDATIEWTVSYKNDVKFGCFIVCANQDFDHGPVDIINGKFSQLTIQVGHSYCN